MTEDTALWETDALLDSLAAGDLPGDLDRGMSLLSALVADISADLPTASPVPDDLRRRRSRLARLAPRTGVALAAAVAVVSTGGVAAASVNAGPTSALFPLHQVLTGQPQLDGSQRQALEVRDKLHSATKALAAGKLERAQKDVTAAAGRIPKVAEVDGRRDLAAQWVVVNKQVKAHVTVQVVPAVPVKPRPVVVPTPDHSPTVTATPTKRPVPVVPPTTTTHAPVVPAPVTTPPAAPTSATATTPSPTQVAPPSPQPSGTVPVVPAPSDAVPSATDSPTPTQGRGGHHGRGGKGATPTPSVAAGSPVDPIVITPTPTETFSAVPGDQTAPAPPVSSAPAAGPSAPAPSASAVVVVVPPSTLPLP